MRFLLLVCVTAAFVGVLSAERLDDLQWKVYKTRYNKHYPNQAEDSMRKALFLGKRQWIERHNGTQSGYKLGLNHLSDWTENELNKLIGPGFDLADKLRDVDRTEQPEFIKKMLEVDVKDLPEFVDWRAYGRVGPVGWQGNCASDWAFSTAGVLEGQQYKFNITPVVTLSAQNVMDCSPSGRDCDGGFMADALKDLASTGGVESEQDYPYLNMQYHSPHHKCAFDKTKSLMKVKGAHLLPKSEEALQKVVAQFGPVAVGLQATNKLIGYGGGILDDDTCVAGYLNLAGLVVGYGTTIDRTQDYWIVKLSWSPEWGDAGYALIAKGKGDKCGLTTIATVPEI